MKITIVGRKRMNAVITDASGSSSARERRVEDQPAAAGDRLDGLPDRVRHEVVDEQRRHQVREERRRRRVRARRMSTSTK